MTLKILVDLVYGVVMWDAKLYPWFEDVAKVMTPEERMSMALSHPEWFGIIGDDD